MGYRGQPIDGDEAAIADIYEKLRTINASLSDRLLPPGYVINEVAGSLVFTRTSDGATTTLSFS